MLAGMTDTAELDSDPANPPPLPFRLGRRPPSNRRALRLRDFLIDAGIPRHPIAADDLGNISFGLDDNDRFGVCGPTAFDNLQRLVTGLLAGAPVALTQQQVFEIYRWQNPAFDPTAPPDPRTGEVPGDNGVDLQTMLEQLLANGYIVGFAKVDLTNEDEVRAAMYLFLGLILGVDLQQAQQGQTNAGHAWDYVAGSPDWGGHAILQGAYDATTEDAISWALRVRMTQSFLRHRRDEAWVVLFRQHLLRPDFRAGFDAPSFAAAFTDITGQPFPIDVGPPPAPDPDPEPAPFPIAAADRTLAAVLGPWAREHRHTGQAARVAAAGRDWLATKGL